MTATGRGEEIESTATADPVLVHHAWTQRRQDEPARTALESPLLALHEASDVDPILPEQVTQARQVLRERRRLVDPDGPGGDARLVADLQRQVVERFLAGRAAYFGVDQCAPLEGVEQLAAEGRDVFVVIKFMDEAPHLAATLQSLLEQRDVDLGRVVIVAVDNNSTDGSDRIVAAVGTSHRTPARIVYLNQTTPGAGNAARLGVDRSIATVHRMCQLDGNWRRLQTAVVAVSDGDTVYHPRALGETLRILETSPTVDGVMPFLIYKLAAGLRLFPGYGPHGDERTTVLGEAPHLGVEAALRFVEDGLRPTDKWRWHAVLGHDIFLQWLFACRDLPEPMVYPDTSDALKTFRAWAFAIGGQHQLRRPGLRTVTGSDYQSGRVLQAVGCTVRLGPAEAYAATEIDRLVKMVRNLAHGQAVFYGQTRSSALERASGLYVHMTRIQGDIEADVRGYDDRVFEHLVFPERMLFALRWILQNALRFYAHDQAEAQKLVRDRVLAPMFGARQAEVEERWFRGLCPRVIRQSPADERLDRAERIAEAIIAATYPQLMAVYRRTLEDFFRAHRVPVDRHTWLLENLEQARNPLAARPRSVDPAAVWDAREFVIDEGRGQVVEMRRVGEAGDVVRVMLDEDHDRT